MEDARYGGLTQKEVKERINAGKTNQSDASTGLTVKQIILSNTLTYFNLIFLVITVLLCIVGSFRNLTFLPIILWNIIIGIIQEWRAKKTLDKMNLLNAPHAIVVRDGKESKVTSEELVQDDVVLLSAGEQICADATVLEGNVQVNESLLTGESDEKRGYASFRQFRRFGKVPCAPGQGRKRVLHIKINVGSQNDRRL